MPFSSCEAGKAIAVEEAAMPPAVPWELILLGVGAAGALIGLSALALSRWRP